MKWAKDLKAVLWFWEWCVFNNSLKIGTMANQVESIAHILKLEKLDQNQSLSFIEAKTKVKPSVIALALIVFITIIIMIAEASAFIVGICCFLIPAYFSFVALESKDKEDDKKFLTYWILFSISEVVAPLFNWILSPTIFTIARVLLTIGLLHPELNLSIKLYDGYISPFLSKE